MKNGSDNTLEKGEYLVPADRATTDINVKKSRFIANAFGVDSRSAAIKYTSDVRAEFADARHHCWAYVIGAPTNPKMVAFSDDGEPSGAAGKPILNVIQHKEVGDILVVITRYFGGVKLGAPGLVRAYSAATQKVYEELNLKLKKVFIAADIEANYSFEQPLRYWLKTHGGELKSVSYKENVVFTISFSPALESELLRFLSASGCKLIKPLS